MRRLLPLAAFCFFLCAGAFDTASGDVRSCTTHEYSYAGFAAAHHAEGVSARIAALAPANVLDGHVAAWVGVGGPGAGPGRTDEWLQVGFSAFTGDANGKLYYELALPNESPQYVELRTDVQAGESHRLTVLEMRRRPSWWRVWVDGQAATPPIHLLRSHHSWRPIATAESWNAGAGVCNAFAYKFGRVVSASVPGGGWRTFTRGYRFQDPGYRVVSDSRASFRALGD
jgi:hypothetical protein